ncbi:unnamed protein product [Symbiodinium microadriaticum]|nr:unnamed protein product [Symbiodinium microadriaticum]
MSAQLYNGDSAAVPKPGPPQGDGATMVNGIAAEGQGTVDPPYGNPDMGANVLTTTVMRDASEAHSGASYSGIMGNSFASTGGCEKRGTWRGVCDKDKVVEIYPRVKMYQKGIRVLYHWFMVYLRVRTYQKGITVLYLYKLRYMEASVYPRVRTYQKGITVLYLYKPLYMEAFVSLRVKMYQKGITVLYLPRLCREGAMQGKVPMGWNKVVEWCLMSRYSTMGRR